MKRSKITLEDVAEWKTLCWAAHRAARGKRNRREIASFFANLHAEINELAQDVLSGTISLGRTVTFRVFDPKPRVIHAPLFRERVLHHALMRHLVPQLAIEGT